MALTLVIALVGIATIGAPDADVWTRAMPISLMLTTAALSCRSPLGRPTAMG
jgi:hypothetical protein